MASNVSSRSSASILLAFSYGTAGPRHTLGAYCWAQVGLLFRVDLRYLMVIAHQLVYALSSGHLVSVTRFFTSTIGNKARRHASGNGL